MGLNDISSGERVHIGFFGMRNAGKSSVVNAVTGQSLSVVSDTKGTTTDPVKKAMELLPIGAVVVIDTPGLDDSGELGEMRIKKAREILAKTDIAVLVVDGEKGMTAPDSELAEELKKRNIPYIIAYNKCDLLGCTPEPRSNEIFISAKNNFNIDLLKTKLGEFAKSGEKKYLISDMLHRGDIAVLVTPIDESAPKGRLILPQQMTLRDILDANCTAIVCQENELADTLNSLSKKPAVVITDSQVFGSVAKTVPSDIPLTSFSILMARYKGELAVLTEGAKKIKDLKDGDTVIISEGCTHHRQCNDIGTVKMPNLIRKYSGCEPNFIFTSGGEFPETLDGVSLVVHCGACMLNEKEMKNRINICRQSNTPIVNYGMAIAQINDILSRSLEIFGL